MRYKIFLVILLFIFVFSGCEPTTGGSTKVTKGTNSGTKKSKEKPEIIGKPPEILFDGFGKIKNSSCEIIPKEKWEYYRDLISEEIKKYPDGYYKVIGSYKICLVRDLKLNGDYVDGFAFNNATFISVGNGTIAQPHSPGEGHMPIPIIVPVYNPDYIVSANYHHEQHHIAEYSLFGFSCYWKEWNNLYKGSYIRVTDSRELPAGFITAYSTFAPEEDRAEIVKYWFIYDYNEKLISKAKGDTVLDQKITLLLTLFRDRLSFPDPLREYNEKMGR